MNIKALLPALLCSAAVMLLQQCTAPDHTDEFIKRPFTNVDVKPVIFELNASESKTFSLPNGTTIEIPANAFADASGNPIAGAVKISYREFHKAEDILASGIPMSYDSGGVKMNFESAGMFEINGSSNDQPVFIAEDKEIKVNMASFSQGNDYNFYFLDQGKGNWTYQGNTAPTENEAKRFKLEALGEAPVQPIMPKKYDGKKFVFDLDVNYKQYPELKEFNGVIWQYSGRDDASNPEKNPALFSQSWTNVELQQQDASTATFTLILSNSKNQFTTTVTPVLKGKNYEKALAKFQQKMKSYSDALATRKAEEARLLAEGDLIRTFAVNSFGIYNWDRQYKDENAVQLAADFKLDRKISMSDITVFLVAGDGRTVIKYPESDWKMFSFKPKDMNKIVAVMPGNKLAVFTNSDFRKIDVNKLRSSSKPKYTFQLRTIDTKISSVDDLGQVLASL